MTNPGTIRRLAVALVGVLLCALFAGASAGPVSAAAGTVTPTQWIAKQFTELLGRAPSDAEWQTWTARYADVGCTTTSLGELTRALALGPEFALRYPEPQPAARIVALTRAAYNHDVNDSDWTAYYAPYAAGTRTWAQTVDQYFGAVFDSLVRPQVCDPDRPGYGFAYSAPLDIAQRVGGPASRTRQQLQSALHAAAPSCGTVELAAYEVVRVTGRPLDVPSCVTLTTSGQPATSAYARQGRLVLSGPVCDTVRCVDVPVVRLAAGARLRNVWVDVNAATIGTKTSAVEVLGSSPATPAVVSQVRVSDPGPGGTAIRLYGVANYGTPCTAAQVSDNLVTGYARSHALDPAARGRWADGIAVFCEQARVERNTVVDVGDWGIGLYGVRNRDRGVIPQRSQVRRNVVISAGVPGSVGLGVDAVGECQAAPLESGRRGGVSVPCVEFPDERSFAGAALVDNRFWTGSRTSFDVGLLVGGKTYWGDHGGIGRGLKVTGNTTGPAGARVNVGVAVSGMLDTTLSGNTGAPGASGAFSLVDTIGGATPDLPGCPQLLVGIGPPRVSSVTAGSQPVVRANGLFGCLLAPAPDGGLERVRPTAAGGGSFVGDRTGTTFTPFGHNYGPTFSDLIDDDWQDPAVFRGIVADLVELRQLGTNTLRLHPQFNRFMLDQDTPDPAAFDRLVRVADAAASLGLYLDVTGLGIWRPADNRDDPGDPTDADEAWLQNPSEAVRWAAQAVFWGETARRLAGHPAVLFFNLMNEPVVASTAWGCPNGTAPFEFCFVQAITLTRQGRNHRDIARAWIGQLTAAIRAHDPDVPIGVGSLAELGWPPSWIGDVTDLMVSHNYPGEDPDFPGDELAQNIAMAKSFKQPGHPLVIEEFSYSLGDGNSQPPDLACWNGCLDRFLRETRPEANGWLGHAIGTPPVRLHPWRDLFTLGWIQFFQYEVPLVAPCGSCQPS